MADVQLPAPKLVRHKSTRKTVPQNAKRTTVRRLSLIAGFAKPNPGFGEDDGEDGPTNRRASFLNLRDSLEVQEAKNSTNDSETHLKRASMIGLQAKIGKPVSFGVVDGATAVPSPQNAPKRSSTMKSRHSNASVQPLSDAVFEKDATEVATQATGVVFGDVTVRDYAMTLGDNPCVRRGHPVSLGWHYEEYKPIQISDFERNHPVRRPLGQLRISPEKRLDYLRNQCEVPWKDLKEARLEVVKTQKRWKKIKEEAEKPPGQIDPSCCVIS